MSRKGSHKSFRMVWRQVCRRIQRSQPLRRVRVAAPQQKKATPK